MTPDIQAMVPHAVFLFIIKDDDGHSLSRTDKSYKSLILTKVKKGILML